jgi:hypothetical protein
MQSLHHEWLWQARGQVSDVCGHVSEAMTNLASACAQAWTTYLLRAV